MAGHGVHRINFNGGDAANWPGGTAYSGTATAWPRFVHHFVQEHAITDLALYGDLRPLHATAIDLARAVGVRVHVFEEGYLRPDWVTLERGGVNGNSALPRDADWFRQTARTLDAFPEAPPLPSYGGVREWAAFFYHMEIVLQHWRFPFYVSHRPLNPVREAWSFLRRKIGRRAALRLDDAALGRLEGCRYLLFPLQLDTDYQIRSHSLFGTMPAALRHVMASFARHAPAGTMLVVKEHPLDFGRHHWRALVAALAQTLGIEDRVVFLKGGDLPSLVEGAAGMVTVNSTSGTLALASGKPVKVLGQAVYDIPDISDQAPLSRFWSEPRAPDADTFDAFRRVLVAYCLLPGAYLSPVATGHMIVACMKRMLDPPNWTPRRQVLARDGAANR